jgi:serine/threonine-protein kinase
MKHIGRYRVRGLLGKGGMGRVYKVSHPVIPRMFALKTLEPAEALARLLGPARLRSLFVDEIRRMADLDHPHIIGVLDADIDATPPFYVMDYHCRNLGQVIGETFRTEAPTRPLPVTRAVVYVRQVLRGLTRLHHAGIVHRDIKPFNILLTAADQVKICDFGLSLLRGERFPAPPTLKVGSPYYAAPEQEEDPDEAGITADLYSAGVMLYRMLSGRLPERPQAAPLSRWQPDLDDAWDVFFEHALAPDPAARFPQAGAMHDDLAALTADWQARWQATCGPLPDAAPRARAAAAGHAASVRALPLKTGPRTSPSRFGLDKLWRPRVYPSPSFVPEADARVLCDTRTGLAWQRGGSPFALDWRQAREYTARLNREGFGGRHNWRLPTIAELITLLQPNPTGRDHCLPPVFDRRPHRLWSSDRRTFTSAWHVDLEMGFVSWQDLTCLNAVKAVSTAAPT